MFSQLDLQKLVGSFFTLSESRGKEAAGIATSFGDTLCILKRNVRGAQFRRLTELDQMLTEISTSNDPSPFMLMGHTRMVTNGNTLDLGNNQPVTRGDLACIHNGIITNDEDIWRNNPSLTRSYEVDTEAFLALIEQELEAGKALASAVEFAIGRTTGANSFAVMSRKADGLLLATTNGSLFYLIDQSAGLVLFASEKYFLEQVLKLNLLRSINLNGSIQQLLPGYGAALSSSENLAHVFNLNAAQVTISLPRVDRQIVDRGSRSTPVKARLPLANIHRLGELERAMHIDFKPIHNLRRCSSCLLPETFPFIEFDSAGVCTMCHGYRAPLAKAVPNLLINTPNTYRTCLAPISGGRDSCFGLHYMVRKMGIKPVAYTYDWGMITDLARRNISRMCGSLGVEHVLISANIARKREYVRKNVTAWLRRPRLGTVPLFMAGDKQFFYYAEKLRQQMKLDTILFSMNPLERTDFKVGFCGINESYNKTIHYNPTILNKARIAFFYGKEFLLNTAYLNSSLIDTLGAYFAYYFLPKRYEQLFDHIPWIESEIEETLINEYDWELARDTKSTWRIGDGTAAFYNYIYLRVAGFTENDTFRSNQIRKGLINRESALAQIEEENKPRIESCAWYFDTIGLDAIEAIKQVNAIPRLY